MSMHCLGLCIQLKDWVSPVTWEMESSLSDYY